MTDARPVDPVCGTLLASWDDQLDRSQAGASYHFCSAQCARRFAEDPDRYAGVEPRPPLRRARERLALPILDLGCGGGASTTIENALLRTPGVLWAYVNPATEMAYIEYHSGLVTDDGLLDVIEELGYRSFRTERRERHAANSRGTK